MEGHSAENHRNCSRAPVELPVEILHGESQSVLGQLSDISFGGAYVETDAHGFRTNDIVTLCFEVEQDDGTRPCALSGTVARAGEEGVAVAFDDYDRETVRALRQVYHHLLR